MIGFLVTGHGEFAVGLESSLRMIAGEQEEFKVVKFEEGAALEEYQSDIKKAVLDLKEKNDGVIIFTDLLGGTPFRISSTIKTEFENIEVITGTNLPMLLEGTIIRYSISENTKELADALTNSAKEGITYSSKLLESENESVDDGLEDGI